MNGVYYNDNDPKVCAWLRELMKQGHLPQGEVDERSIWDVRAEDLRGYRQVHLFAGIGGWPYALRLAGWPDDRPVWTGSCPCQPFSHAGKGMAEEDERHLWPAFRDLIAEHRPATVFGEQVASRLGREWLAGVRTDLEALGYAVGTADLCAASIGAPHIRQRLYWVANSETAERRGIGQDVEGRRTEEAGGSSSGMVLSDSTRSQSRDETATTNRHGDTVESTGSGMVHPAYAEETRLRSFGISVEPEQETKRPTITTYWAGSEFVRCADRKSRRVKSGLPLLAHGVPGVLVVVCSECKEERRFVDGSNSEWRETSSETTIYSNSLHALWLEVEAATPTSSRSKSAQQPHRKHSDSLYRMPQTRTLTPSEAEYVRGLWQRVRCQRSSQTCENLLCPVCNKMGPHKCYETVASRVTLLRGYGNAIVPQLAATFIRAAIEAMSSK